MAPEIGLEAAGVNEPPEPKVVVALAAPPGPGAPASPRAHVAGQLQRVHERLAADPHSFGFFQAVRLLERLHPERDPVGARDPGREVVRFHVNPSLAFPASEIQQLTLDDGQPAMMVNFMGLVGPQGVLPHFYSLLVSERLRARDAALADFLDMFHHRLLSLFYQAWRKYRFTLALEDGAPEALGGHLADLIGLGLAPARDRLPFPDQALLHRAGLLMAQARGAVGLEQLLEDFFAVPVQVEQFVGGWYALRAGDCCMLGADEDGCSQLGGGAVVGDEVWDPQARVRVRIGPLDREHYEAFLPGRPGHDSLRALLRFYARDEIDFELQLVLASPQVPGLVLGGGDGQPPQLGWTTWICTSPRATDADETLLTLHAGAAS